MLSPTFIHKEEADRLYKKAMLDPMAMFAQYSSYWSLGYISSIEESDWSVLSRVSKDHDGNLLGVISADISRDHYLVTSLFLISFTKCQARVEFVRDVFKFVDELLTRYKFNRVEFSVIVDNPVMSAYDRAVAMIGGREIGVCRKSVRLTDGDYHDKKLYEVLRSEYHGIPKAFKYPEDGR